jgi:glycosyltransferase involved in cell wall biosynthesis
VQRSFLERADRVLLASSWAADSARELYGLDPARVSVAPMGANLDTVPDFELPDLNAPLTLLFVGYAWERKGGPLVVEAWRELRRRTGNARLHIVGATPGELVGVEGVTLHGRLSKNNPNDYRTLVDLYRQSHFFFMPSRQEAFGIVYCEAAAFGRPVVAANTGAIETIVKDHETGLILPADADGIAYADQILALWNDKDRFAANCCAARHRYETVLNWQAWGDKVELALREVAHPPV